MSNKGDKQKLLATSQALGPGDFPIGSVESRAAMRAMIERKGEEKPLMKIVLERIGGDSNAAGVPEIVRSESSDCVTEFWKNVPGGLTEEEARRLYMRHEVGLLKR